jgi:predicted metal-dependent hydrolase
VSHKSEKIAAMLQPYFGKGLDAHYLAFFGCFNQQLFFEAHEVLEDLWLADRGPDRAFYQGLIQLAGAFVHFQKNRLKPASALLRLAAANLGRYPLEHQNLSVHQILARIVVWQDALVQSSFATNPFVETGYPTLSPPSSRSN